MATLLFALVLHPVIERIKEVVPSLLVNGWFLDDGLLAGTRGEVIKAVGIVLEMGPARGLHLSTELSVPGNSKSAVWSMTPLDENPLGLGIKPISEDGFIHLGAPVGGSQYVAEQIKVRVEKVKHLLNKLPLLECPLRGCASTVMFLVAQS